MALVLGSGPAGYGTPFSNKSINAPWGVGQAAPRGLGEYESVCASLP